MVGSGFFSTSFIRHATLPLAMSFAHWYMSAAARRQGVRLRTGTGRTRMHQQLRGQEQVPAATQEGAGLDPPLILIAKPVQGLPAIQSSQWTVSSLVSDSSTWLSWLCRCWWQSLTVLLLGESSWPAPRHSLGGCWSAQVTACGQECHKQ